MFRNLNSKFDIVSYNHLFYIYATVSGKIASRGSTLAAGNQPAPEFPFYVSPSLRNDSHHLHFLLHAGIYAIVRKNAAGYIFSISSHCHLTFSTFVFHITIRLNSIILWKTKGFPSIRFLRTNTQTLTTNLSFFYSRFLQPQA